MGIFSLVLRVIAPVTSQLTTVFQSILSDFQSEAVKPFVKNGLNKSVTSSQAIGLTFVFMEALITDLHQVMLLKTSLWVYYLKCIRLPNIYSQLATQDLKNLKSDIAGFHCSKELQWHGYLGSTAAVLRIGDPIDESSLFFCGKCIG